MLKFYELNAILIKLGFCATVIVNLIFINLTLFYTSVITGTYKKMLVFFAASCVLVSTLEVIVQPCIHNFNGSAGYFSLAEGSLFSKDFLYIGLLVYASCYFAQLVFIAIQFLFRYFILIQHPYRKSFHGPKQLFWILYYIFSGVFYGLFTSFCLPQDNYSDTYLQEELLKIYERDIKDTPRILAVAYENGRVRWSTVTFFCLAFLGISSQYLIIIFCSIKMQNAIQTKLSRMSSRNQKLEQQFFKALIIQIILPTFLITIPIGSVLLLPLLDIKISFQSGIIYALYSLYPPLDSIATMVIVKEYKCCVRRLLKDLGTFAFDQSTNVSTSQTGNGND